MNFEIRWLDVTDNLKQGRQPWAMIERPHAGARTGSVQGDSFSVSNPARVGEFWVPQNALLPDDPQAEHEITWTLTTTGDLVRVPVHGYLTLQPAKSALVATGLELGMRAMSSLVRRCHKRPTSVVLVLGTECHHIKDAYRLYLGLAIRVG